MSSVPALVIGDMDLVRPLGEAGVRCIAAGHSGPETAWSRHTTGSLRLPDLWAHADDAVERLVRHAERTGERSVLIYQTDPSVLAISRHRDVLSRHYRFVVPEREVVEDLVDKRRFQSRAGALGLPVAPSAFVRAGVDAAPSTGLRYPLVVKPVLRERSQETWWRVSGGAKAVIVETAAELEAVWQRPEIAGAELVVQEYVAGDTSALVSYHAYIDDDGSVVGEFTGRKIRTWPPEVGQSTAVEITDDPLARELGRAVLERFGLTGVAKVDMKVDVDGTLRLLEVNPRFNLWHHPAAMAGVNLPYAVYRRLVDGVPPPTLPPARPGTRWIQVWGDWRASAHEGIGRLTWFRDVADTPARRAAHLTDPGAMLGALTWAGVKRWRSLSARP